MDITVQQLKEKLDRNDDFLLLDVRTTGEYDTARIEAAQLLPLQQLPHSLDRLNEWRDKEIVCMCHHGGRSAAAQEILLQAGFSNVLNLTGGINAYSRDIDPDIPQYF